MAGFGIPKGEEKRADVKRGLRNGEFLHLCVGYISQTFRESKQVGEYDNSRRLCYAFKMASDIPCYVFLPICLDKPSDSYEAEPTLADALTVFRNLNISPIEGMTLLLPVHQPAAEGFLSAFSPVDGHTTLIECIFQNSHWQYVMHDSKGKQEGIRGMYSSRYYPQRGTFGKTIQDLLKARPLGESDIAYYGLQKNSDHFSCMYWTFAALRARCAGLPLTREHVAFRVEELDKWVVAGGQLIREDGQACISDEITREAACVEVVDVDDVDDDDDAWGMLEYGSRASEEDNQEKESPKIIEQIGRQLAQRKDGTHRQVSALLPMKEPEGGEEAGQPQESKQAVAISPPALPRASASCFWFGARCKTAMLGAGIIGSSSLAFYGIAAYLESAKLIISTTAALFPVIGAAVGIAICLALMLAKCCYDCYQKNQEAAKSLVM